MSNRSPSVRTDEAQGVDFVSDDVEYQPPCTPKGSHLGGAPNGTISNEGNAFTSFLLIGKLKTVVNEVLYNLENHSNQYDVDEFIAVTEDCLRALRTVKVERRIEARRMTLSMRNQGSPTANILSTPSNRDSAEPGEETARSVAGAGSQGPQNYKAALLKPKRPSPKHSPIRSTENQTRGDVEASRYASALRGEERQRQAEERRFDLMQEMKQKSELSDARSIRAKARREEAERKQRVETQDRMEGGVRRAEEARRQTREKAQRAHSHVDEVLLTKELQQQNKVLMLEKKMSEVEHNQEQMREKLQRQAQERQEAVRAAAERRRNLSQERLEKQQQREQHRLDNLRRVDEEKKQEQELKQQKAKEWEKKVQQHHVDATAEAEALSRKTEEKFQQSAQLLEEQREKRQQKLERQELKLREAKKRRDEELEARPTLAEMMPQLSNQEEEQQAARLSRLSTTSAQHAKVFADKYQKMSTQSTKDLNRSRLRAVFSRLSAAVATPSVTQCKHPLNEINSAAFTDVDYEYVRYFNAFETLIKVLVEARKARDFTVLRQTTDILQSWFVDEKQGRENVIYFIKSGCAVLLVLYLADETRTLRREQNPEALRCGMEIFGICLERICADAQTATKLVPVRDQLLKDMDMAGLDRICVAILRMSNEEEDLQLAYTALCIIHTELGVLTRRKGEVKKQWFQQVTTALFTLLQNMLTPGGSPLQEKDSSLSCDRVTILFCLFRTLNTLARWQLVMLQELLHDGSADTAATLGATTAAEGENIVARAPSADSSAVVITRTELFHVLNGLFRYIHGHLDDMEVVPPASEDAGSGASGKDALGSFAEALQFGVTLNAFPVFPGAAAADPGVSMKPGGKHYHLRATLHECILLVGYLCFDDAPLQDMMGWGKDKPLLGNMLRVLPITYFSHARHILFPTVLSALLQNHRNALIVREEMSLAELRLFVQQEYEPLTKKAKMYAQAHHKQLLAHKMETDPRFALRMKLQGKSWVDMEDDDSLPGTPRSSETTSTTPVVEKENLCKGLRATSMNPSNYFKLERRLPISYWPGVMDLLEKLQQM
ncbi:hypothetical protein ABB37_08496 [Leptomonas pyrrhocoris]|uniref:Uncharacterized protein n=1 Tax=Leptomonas pyrrhocoris TaxID=157538 RepID=A0A0M9FTD3_LEPPY|nr:hypothetical protein ABB37_08496 [Leptomonas pyrrhocoris]XP_015654071.1 hypothetical protein ABB37_08496 [Leptomonas pyrrhocoris]XP_015654072.1 hypothetical protein ABB37_08496 [Leptomonas pyrrhocoris]KPA75631.1 hypothetical protein ABB37_08496 [Leptomonas pyrrhocoris]KPA75632.1 hypothetical protein ABB37_08496 [Leptomonas pyrrhocoris]KPA75633.1 hypothetical protein ABB37_08496 [Leptomonas pyrrhocoris]|eukprot:XP_015654070.1 hypothetical protein ABB37_08496 [Leptomonas pyrrhocoris]